LHAIACAAVPQQLLKKNSSCGSKLLFIVLWVFICMLSVHFLAWHWRAGAWLLRATPLHVASQHHNN